MSTTTKRQNQAAYAFNDSGVCVNPDKIPVPMPTGWECELLVAQQEDGAWCAGFKCDDRDNHLIEIAAKDCACGEETREKGIELALEMALANCDAYPAVMTSLEIFKNLRRLKGGKKISPAGENLVTTPTANASAPADACLADPAAVTDGAAARSDVAGESPAGETVAAVLPGTHHEWNDAGVCAKPTVFEIPKMPKGTHCAVSAAQATDGSWRHGAEYGCESENVGSLPMLKSREYASSSKALLAGLREAELFFSARGAKKAFQLVARKIAEWADEDDLAEMAAADAPKQSPIYKTSFAELAVAKIQRNPENHRQHFDGDRLRELADSILAEGLHQPIAVRRLLALEVPEGELPIGDSSAPEYELIFGERRWRAMKLAQGTTITAKVYEDLPRHRAHAIALIENLQRVDINCMEESEGYAALMSAETLTQEQCATRVGKARSTVANSLRLLKLPERVRDHLREMRLTLAHGVALARFVPDEKDRADFPKWEMIVNHMADEVVKNKTPAGAIERQVPCVYSLCQAGLAVRVSQYGEDRVTDKLKRHAAYFAEGDGDWICFNPDHWTGEVEARKAAQKEREEKERAKREAEIAAAAKKGKKQLQLADLNRDDYRELEGVDEALLELVPEDKRAIAKGHDGRKRDVVTDVQLADRLKSAMMRAIKENRREAVKDLEEKLRKKIGAVKKVGPREMAWLVFSIVSGERSELSLSAEAAKDAGVKLAKGALDLSVGESIDWEKAEKRKEQRVAELAKCEAVDLVKTLATSRLASALGDIVESGPDSAGAKFCRWWLDSDTLWLLEESEDGRAELVEKVKTAKWYAKVMAGEEGAE